MFSCFFKCCALYILTISYKYIRGVPFKNAINNNLETGYEDLILENTTFFGDPV